MTEEDQRQRMTEIMRRGLLQVWRLQEGAMADWSEDERDRGLGDLLMRMGEIRDDLERQAIDIARADGWDAARLLRPAHVADGLAALEVKGSA